MENFAVGEAEYIGQERNSFLNRFCNGDIASMVSAYPDNHRLSEKEIDSLRNLLSENTGKEDR